MVRIIDNALDACGIRTALPLKMHEAIWTQSAKLSIISLSYDDLQLT